MDRINLAQDRGNWWPVVNTVMKFRVHKTREILCFLRYFQLFEKDYIKLVGSVGWFCSSVGRFCWLVGWLVFVGWLCWLVGWLFGFVGWLVG